jgi:hypothetical protein
MNHSIQWTPKSRRTRYALLAASLGFVATAGSLASAAGLGVAPKTLGAGTAVIASCDSDGVTTRFVTAYVPASQQFRVSQVIISGISNACNAKRLQITLKRSTGVALRSQTVASLALPVGTTSVTVNIGGTVLVTNVAGSAIIITG